MKKYTFRCFVQHCKMLLALVLIILLSSILSFQIAEFACWLRQCNCIKLLNQETIITRTATYKGLIISYMLKIWTLIGVSTAQW